jgi:hypothetical protein
MPDIEHRDDYLSLNEFGNALLLKDAGKGVSNYAELRM